MEILYEDRELIICRKEAGLAVQSGRIGEMDLVSILRNERKKRMGGEGTPYLGIVHRLDQPVQGLLAFAGTKKAAADLSAQLTDGRMNKVYTAVVCLEADAADPPGGCLTDWLCRDRKTNMAGILPEGSPGAKRAELEYELLERTRDGRHALLKIRLHTGRFHQIRVQMAGAGMPLAGDRKYGDPAASGPARLGGLALCASELSLIHPSRGERMTFTCRPQGPVWELFSSVRGDKDPA